MARAIAEWMLRELSSDGVRIHDHWVYPYIADHDPTTCFVLGPSGIISEEWRYGFVGTSYDSAKLTEEWASEVRALNPWLLEQLQRIMVWRHMHHTVIAEEWDSIQVGLHYAEAVYAPLYYGYGEPGSFADRRRRAREWDRSLLEFAPETVLVLLRATPEAIRKRMSKAARPDRMPREEDIKQVIDLFEEQYAESELNHKVAIETSGVTVEKSVAEFARKVQPFLTEEERRRMPGSGG
ncbi:MAG: hypothetical protein O3A47_02935 [Chloroflexi bacterium]|nr:hypothetical protein [Chloroflexota bacterium]